MKQLTLIVILVCSAVLYGKPPPWPVSTTSSTRVPVIDRTPDEKVSEPPMGIPPTDLQGRASSGGMSMNESREVADSQSTTARTAFAREATAELKTWDKRIAILKAARAGDTRQEHIRQVELLLESLRGEAKKDIRELSQVRENEWLDVKARLEARFHKMDKEYHRIVAE